MRFRPIKAGLIVLLSSFGYFNFQSFGFCLFEAAEKIHSSWTFIIREADNVYSSQM